MCFAASRYSVLSSGLWVLTTAVALVRCCSPPLCSTPATGKKPPALRLGVFMPVVGVEPTRYHYQWILSPHRLPFRHTGTSVDVQQHYYSGFLHQNQAVFFLFSRASYGSGRSPPCAGLFTSRLAAGLFRKYPLFPARVCAVFCPAPVLPRCAPGSSIAVSYIPLSPRRQFEGSFV